MSAKQMPKGVRYGESVFDVLYLLFDLIAGIVFLVHGAQNSLFCLWALLVLLLGGGDAFHLLPRVRMHLRGREARTEAWLGIGTAVTSVMMTAFYLVLFAVWQRLYPELHVPAAVTGLLWACALVRIVLCLCPQNRWTTGGNARWALLRNLPFAVIGVVTVALFAWSGGAHGYGLGPMAAAVALSFVCYFAVVLGAKRKPMLGMLMMPKTLMYIWMLAMGLRLIGRL